jgi:hypothetical protein
MMVDRVESYKQKAIVCELEAERLPEGSGARDQFLSLAAQWRSMAANAEQLEAIRRRTFKNDAAE